MNNNKYKILIIEDEEHINNLLSTLMEANGYQALSARSCQSGELLYASHRPDLVILDLFSSLNPSVSTPPETSMA